MSSELERRLEGLLGVGPEPEQGAGEEALHRALRALRPAAPARRGLRTAVVVFAVAVVLLAIAAGSLAAAGALHVSLGAKKKQARTPAQLLLPKGADGIAAIVDGRLSVVTKGGFQLQGLQAASAATLSPHALFVAAGIGKSLVAIAPDGRRPWLHAAGGRVVAIAWAPDAIRIAYVVHEGRHFVLHVIWGNGKNDAVIDRSVRPVRPSWRSDSLAFAYVGGGGRAIVYDLGHRKRRIVGGASTITRVAFAPAGQTLALATPSSVILGGRTVARGGVEALGWRQDNRLEVAVEMGVTAPLVRMFEPSGRALAGFRVPGRVVAITGGFVVSRTSDKVLAGWRAKSVRTIFDVRPTTSVADLAIG